MSHLVRPGIDRLLHECRDFLEGNVALVCHAASVTSTGEHSSVALRKLLGRRLACLFGPEHGVQSKAGAGQWVDHQVHPRWKIPIYSLYGTTRRPTREMLEGISTLVFDLQDIGARPYTYVSTLREVLEAAAEFGCRVVIADRPAALANIVDGPMLDARFDSFVAHIPAPVVYGMTPGETALWLKGALKLNVEVLVARCAGYHRQARPRYRWVPPSPAIVSWESALCFPITVFFEAIPTLDHGRGTPTPFQTIASPRLDWLSLLERLRKHELRGVTFEGCSYIARMGLYAGQPVQGLKLNVVHPRRYEPVKTAICLIEELTNLLGPAAIWGCRESRPEFFDKLMGTDRVRVALQKGVPAESLFADWNKQTFNFKKTRESLLLY